MYIMCSSFRPGSTAFAVNCLKKSSEGRLWTRNHSFKRIFVWCVTAASIINSFSTIQSVEVGHNAFKVDYTICTHRSLFSLLKRWAQSQRVRLIPIELCCPRLNGRGDLSRVGIDSINSLTYLVHSCLCAKRIQWWFWHSMTCAQC